MNEWMNESLFLVSCITFINEKCYCFECIKSKLFKMLFYTRDCHSYNTNIKNLWSIIIRSWSLFNVPETFYDNVKLVLGENNRQHTESSLEQW